MFNKNWDAGSGYCVEMMPINAAQRKSYFVISTTGTLQLYLASDEGSTQIFDLSKYNVKVLHYK